MGDEVIYSDCDPDRPTTPESRLRDALEADVARHLSEIQARAVADQKWLQRVALDADYLKSMGQQGALDADRLWRSRAMARALEWGNPYCQGVQTGEYQPSVLSSLGW